MTISDGPHAVEFDWQAATAAGANDGRFDFWVDGVQWGMETTVDSDTLRVETAQLGILTGPVAGTTGSVYFDAFEARSETSIGLDPVARRRAYPAAPPVLPFPEKQDAVFADGFEGGNWNAWSSATGTSKLAVNAAAALEGSQGLEITTNNTGSTLNAFLTDWTPFDEDQYHARFNLDPNTIGLLTNGNCVVLFYGQGRSGSSYTTPFRLCLVNSGGQYQLRADTAKDDGTSVMSQNVTITDAPHSIELAWQSATTTSPSDGSFNLWVDGTLAISLSEVDNDTVRVDQVNFGLSGAQSGTTGSLYLDGFASTRRFASKRWSYIDITPPQASAAQPKVLALPLPFLGWRLPLLQTGQEETRTISYVYDELYRLTEANYSDGAYFHYTYDANGNRISETTPAGTLCSYYDIANKLTAVYANGQNTTCPAEAPQGSTAYTWDDNGNLLSDGTYIYSYDHANRLKSVTQGTNVTSFSYNGLGDRVQETANGVTATFALDLNTGQTQVLSDGTNTYLYGKGRIGQFSEVDSTYFLGDALGSVRQLVDGNGEVILAKDYEPYGEVMSSAGSGSSSYGYISEWAEANFIYLRARIYSALIGKFTSRDSWEGNLFTPASYNQWLYGYSNPITFVDHTGNQALCTEPDCDILEDENKKNWTEIAYGLKFTADSGASWSTRNRLETIKGVVAVAKKMAELVMEKGNYSIKPSELYKKVFKDDLVTFHWLTNAGAICERRWPQQGVEAGVQCYNNNNVTAVQMAHELGHVFNAAIENKISRGEILRTTVSPYDLLTSKGISYLKEKDGNCEIVWAANYQSGEGRTFEGMDRIYIQNITPTSNEDFADMFAHWTFNYFPSNPAGNARKHWMDKNMTLWLYRILYPHNQE